MNVELLEPFISDLKQTIRAQTIEALDGVLGNGHAQHKPLKKGELRVGLGRNLELRAPNVKLSRTVAGSSDVLAYIRKNPNSRADQIRVALGIDPKAALVELREAKRVKTTGQRRGTRYAAR